MNTLIKFFFLSIFISSFSFAEQEIIVNDDSPILMRLGSENFKLLKESLDANEINQVVASDNLKFRKQWCPFCENRTIRKSALKY